MLEHDPQPSRAVYELLVKALQKSEPPEKQFELDEALHDVYKAFSTKDSPLILALSKYQEKGLISSDDKLYLFVLFNVAKTIGPYNLAEVRTFMVNGATSQIEANKFVEGLIMDVVLKDYLRSVVGKLSPTYPH